MFMYFIVSSNRKKKIYTNFGDKHYIKEGITKETPYYHKNIVMTAKILEIERN